MSNPNEITIKINVSDDLLAKVLNVWAIASSPMPMLGMAMPQQAQQKTKQPIGFTSKKK